MKYVDINRKFTEAVNEYTAKGYTFNTSSMRGSQGEIARVDLTNGTEIIRIILDTFSQFEPFAEGVEIVVGRYNENKVVPNTNSSFDTLWNNELDIIKTERFYKLSSNVSIDYYGTMEEATAANEVRLARWRERGDNKQKTFTSDAALEIAKRAIRRKLGTKRITTADVKIQKDKRGYSVSYHGKTVALR